MTFLIIYGSVLHLHVDAISSMDDITNIHKSSINLCILVPIKFLIMETLAMNLSCMFLIESKCSLSAFSYYMHCKQNMETVFE